MTRSLLARRLLPAYAMALLPAAALAGPTQGVTQKTTTRAQPTLATLLERIPKRRDSKPLYLYTAKGADNKQWMLRYGLEAEFGQPKAVRLLAKFYGPRNGLSDFKDEHLQALLDQNRDGQMIRFTRKGSPVCAEAKSWQEFRKLDPWEQKRLLKEKFTWDDISEGGRVVLFNKINIKKKGGFPELVKLSSAPEGWNLTLNGEGNGVFEISTKPTDNLQAVYRAIDEIKDTFGEGVGFHLHITYNAQPPGKRALKDPTSLVAAANWAIYGRSFIGGESFVAHKEISIPTASTFAAFRKSLTDKDGTRFRESRPVVSFRDYSVYGNDEKLRGLEIRGLGADPEGLKSMARLLSYGLVASGKVQPQGAPEKLDYSRVRLIEAVKRVINSSEGVVVSGPDGRPKRLAMADLHDLEQLLVNARRRNPPAHEQSGLDQRAYFPWANWSEMTYLPADVRQRTALASDDAARRVAVFAYEAKQKFGDLKKETEKYGPYDSYPEQLKNQLDSTYQFFHNVQFVWAQSTTGPNRPGLPQALWTSLHQ